MQCVYRISCYIVLVSCMIWMTSGHGRLVHPVGRATMWRQGYDTPHDYNDHQLYCGGRGHQWNVNHGKCGVCGDPFDQPQPRDHEAGGKYGKGIIVERYTQGQVIKVHVEITANHGGNFEFRICDTNDPKIIATEECLNRNLLATTSGETKIKLPPGRDFSFKLVLSPYLTCSHCVFQWKWEAAQNPGNQQEHFINCADISIDPKSVRPQPIIIQTPKPYIPLKPTPYIPPSRKPTLYIPPSRKPYVPQTTDPYIPQTYKPYVPQTLKPYIPVPLKPYIQLSPNIPHPPFSDVVSLQSQPPSTESLIPPFLLLKPKCPLTCSFYCPLSKKICPNICKMCHPRNW